jgi:hypothetical protein
MALWSLDVFEAWNRAFGKGGVRICDHIYGCMPSLATLGASMLEHTRARPSTAIACHEPEEGAQA